MGESQACRPQMPGWLHDKHLCKAVTNSLGQGRRRRPGGPCLMKIADARLQLQAPLPASQADHPPLLGNLVGV